MAVSYNMIDAKYKGEKAIRLFLAQKATANPEQFMKDLTSSSFELMAEVNSAFMYGILTYDMPYIRWAKKKEGDNRILTVPSGKDHVDYMVHWLREVDKSGVLNQVRTEVERAAAREHGVEIKANEQEYDGFLKVLGVGSIDELKQILARSKDSTSPQKEIPQEVADVINNLGAYSSDILKKLDSKLLKQIGKHLEIKGWQVLGVDNLITKIIDKNKQGVVASA